MRRWGQMMSVNCLPSKFIDKQSTHINLPPTHLQPDFAPLRFFSKMFQNTEIAQNLSGGLIRPTLQSEKKTFGGQEKKFDSLFSGPLTLRRLKKIFSHFCRFSQILRRWLIFKLYYQIKIKESLILILFIFDSNNFS